MIDSMPIKRPPFLQRDISRLGKVRWYVRKGAGDGDRGKRVRLPDEYGSDEFWVAYRDALAGGVPKSSRPQKASSGTLAWLIDRYRASAAWSQLSPATRKQRENFFVHIIKSAGNTPANRIEKRHLVEARDRRASTPGAANNFLKTLRALFSWAVESDLLDADPAKDVKRIKIKTEGFYAWTEDDLRAFEARWPVGTRERLAMALLLYTGLRRGDAARVGRQHVREGVILLRTEKTGAPVSIPILPELQAVIDASPTGTLAFVARHDGQQMTKESFGNWFREAARSAGVPGNAHGLRKAGAARAAQNGATEAQLNAIFGWSDGSRESATYTRSANREQMARMGIGAMADRNEKSTPGARPLHPDARTLKTVK